MQFSAGLTNHCYSAGSNKPGCNKIHAR